MNSTTLSAALGADGLKAQVASATGASAGKVCKIGNEFAFVDAVDGTVISLRMRGSRGTQVKAHPATTPVHFCDASELAAPGPRQADAAMPHDRDFVVYDVTGAITLPTRDTTILLNGAAACVMTLADPSALADDVELTILSGTAQAHTVTLTTGVYGSNASDKFTFAAVGQSVTLRAYKGKWAFVASSMNVDETSGAYPTID